MSNLPELITDDSGRSYFVNRQQIGTANRNSVSGFIHASACRIRIGPATDKDQGIIEETMIAEFSLSNAFFSFEQSSFK